MITVELFYDDQESLRAFCVKGHAGAAPYGQDIVCAAVSVLSQAAVIGLSHFLSKAPETEIKQGWLRCVLPGDLSAKEEELSQVVLKTMELGLKALEPDYGKYFKIHKRRWTR
ncbi:MAG TPA: ribosomal-processing cysteine protease Prp [Clostridia bacterium]|nr:ribosomal-processing cysteine protease Prp [Clostridia bacterium]